MLHKARYENACLLRKEIGYLSLPLQNFRLKTWLVLAFRFTTLNSLSSRTYKDTLEQILLDYVLWLEKMVVFFILYSIYQGEYG